MESAQAELAETRQQGDSELTKLGNEWDNTKQSLEDLEVCFSYPAACPHQHVADSFAYWQRLAHLLLFTVAILQLLMVICHAVVEHACLCCEAKLLNKSGMALCFELYSRMHNTVWNATFPDYSFGCSPLPPATWPLLLLSTKPGPLPPRGQSPFPHGLIHDRSLLV